MHRTIRDILLKPPYAGMNCVDCALQMGLWGSQLKLVLDAGDIRSWDTSISTQQWFDLTGNGNHFFLGTTGAATATDPTFNGVQGHNSRHEYFSSDGGDLFRLTIANPTWITNLHKDNARYTIGMWIYNPGGITTADSIMGDVGVTGSGTGWRWTVGGVGNHFIGTFNAGVIAVNSAGSQEPLAIGWNFIAVSHDEATGVAYFQVNGNIWATTGITATSPSTGNASQTMEIFAHGNSQNPMIANARIASVMAWEGYHLLPNQMLGLYYRQVYKFR